MLTPRAMEVLRMMLQGDEEFVAEGIHCWVGDVQVSRATLRQLLRCLALKDVSDQSGIERYVVNDIGKAILERPALAEEVAVKALAGQGFTVIDGSVVDMSPDGSFPTVNHPGR